MPTFAAEGPAPASLPRRGRRPVGSGQVDTALAARARPVSPTRDQALPVPAPLAALLPAGLRRGGAVLVEAVAGVGGATTLALALVAAASSAGSWAAVVGLGDPGVVAISELGGDLERLVLVPRPGAMWPEASAELLGGVDVVLVHPSGPARPALARRLVARARERRAALVVLADHGRFMEGPDVRLTVERGEWEGVESGHGHLRGRRVTVAASGRRAAARTVRAELWLPGASGSVEVCGDVPGEGGASRRGDAEERCGEAVAGGVVPRSPAGGGER